MFVFLLLSAISSLLQNELQLCIITRSCGKEIEVCLHSYAFKFILKVLHHLKHGCWSGFPIWPKLPCASSGNVPSWTRGLAPARCSRDRMTNPFRFFPGATTVQGVTDANHILSLPPDVLHAPPHELDARNRLGTKEKPLDVRWGCVVILCHRVTRIVEIWNLQVACKWASARIIYESARGKMPWKILIGCITMHIMQLKKYRITGCRSPDFRDQSLCCPCGGSIEVEESSL